MICNIFQRIIVRMKTNIWQSERISRIFTWTEIFGQFVSNRDDRRMATLGGFNRFQFQSKWFHQRSIFTILFSNSSKIREEDYRQIRTNVPFLAPEILAVFANSQIFHDNQPNKSLAIVHKSPSALHEDARKHSRTDLESEKKLLKRLEGIKSIYKRCEENSIRCTND